MAGERAWENDHKKYPMVDGSCDNCGHIGRIKLATDLRRYLCLDARACIKRAMAAVRA